MLGLNLVCDSFVEGQWFDDPILLLYKNGKAQSYCPCFAYHQRLGEWKEIEDSVYKVSLTEQLSDYYYLRLSIDSAITDSGVVFSFITPKGKPIKNLKLRVRGDSVEYQTDSKGSIYFATPYNTYRYEIDIPKYKKGFKRTVLVNPNPNMSYTITLSKPKKSYTLNYMLKKEDVFWVIFTDDFKQKVAFFTTDFSDPYEGK